MRALSLPSGPLRLLCLGAHADDIEIGCGGTILSWLGAHPHSTCRWVVCSGRGTVREQEARNSAARFLASAGEHRIDVHDFRDGHFPPALSALKDTFETIRREFTPDVILTHTLDDRHQDHRTLAEVSWQTFRDHLVLEYEVPKYDGDLGRPQVYVPLDRSTAARKVEILSAAFPSQRGKHWFGDDTFLALLRLRGLECAAPEGYAEAFHGRKLVLGGAT